MSVQTFNVVLLDISNKLSDAQLDQLKYLCNNDIGKRDMEKIDSGWKLFQFLTERSKLGPDNTEYVCHQLQNIQRPDLADILRHFRENHRTIVPGQQPPEAETAKLRIATEVVAENLGGTWRKLGRRLGLTEVKLESISKRHPTDLEETAMELLKEWRICRGAQARTDDLIIALRDCGFNLTADKIEDKLSL